MIHNQILDDTGKLQIVMDFTPAEYHREIDKITQLKKKELNLDIKDEEVQNKVGLNNIINDALFNLYKENFYDVLRSEKLVILVEPLINVKSLQDGGVELIVETALKPTFTIEKYKGFKIKRKEINISPKEVEDELNRQLSRYAVKTEINDRKTVLGDTVNIDYEGFLDGKAFEGGTAKGYDLKLGSKTFIPGFEDGLVGYSKGDKVDLNIAFPDNYHKNLAGKKVLFKVKINGIYSEKWPEFNDEWVKANSKFNSTYEYRERIRQSLKDIYAKREEEKLENEILDKIGENIDINISTYAIYRRKDALINTFKKKLQENNLTLEGYCEIIGTTVKEFEKKCLDDAERDLKRQLIIEEVIKLEGISLEEYELNNYLQDLAKDTGESVDSVRLKVDLIRIQNKLVLDKLFDMLKRENVV